MDITKFTLKLSNGMDFTIHASAAPGHEEALEGLVRGKVDVISLTMEGPVYVEPIRVKRTLFFQQ